MLFPALVAKAFTATGSAMTESTTHAMSENDRIIFYLAGLADQFDNLVLEMKAMGHAYEEDTVEVPVEFCQIARRLRDAPHERRTAEEVVKYLATECDLAGGQREWAARHQVSPQYVCDVLRGRRRPGEAICQALEFKRVELYEAK